MSSRILIINQNQGFAVTVKRALEQTGDFVVHVFTELDAALEFLKDEPQDLALVDLALPGLEDVIIVHQLRAMQPGLPIIASPRYRDAEAVMRAMDLQGMVDSPFNVRNVIPLIEDIVEQIDIVDEEAVSAQDADSSAAATETGSVVEDDLMWMYQLDEEDETPDDSAGDESGFLDQFEIIDSSLIESAEADTAEIDSLDEVMDADEVLPPWEIDPPGTYMLDDSNLPDEAADDVPDTAILDEEDLYGTAVLDDSQLPDEPDDDSLERRILGTDADNPPGTRMFEGDAPGQTHPLSDEELDQINFAETHQFGYEEEPGILPTDVLPEEPQFSSLESVLADLDEFLLDEPPVYEDDTPDVPSPTADDVFSELVDSMRHDPEPRRLADRQRDNDFMEIILSGAAMDDLVSEIRQREGTDELDDTRAQQDDDFAADKPAKESEPVDAFEALAAEEPPIPDFEESGTVSDLILGVEDSGFKNVLAILRGGEEAVHETTDGQPDLSLGEMEEAFTDFYQPQTQDTPLPAYVDDDDDSDIVPDFMMDFVEADDDDDPTPAEVVLKTTFDDSPQGDAFSIDELIASIERQLPKHRPKIKPLPSWLEDSQPVVLGSPPTESPPEIAQPPEKPTKLPEVPVDEPLPFDEAAAELEAAAAEAWLNPPDMIDDTVVDSAPPETLPELDLPDWFDDVPPEEEFAEIPEPPTLPEMELNEFFDDSGPQEDAAIFEQDVASLLEAVDAEHPSVTEFEGEPEFLDEWDAETQVEAHEVAGESLADEQETLVEEAPDAKPTEEVPPEVRSVTQLPDWWRGTADDDVDDYIADLEAAEYSPPPTLPELDQPAPVDDVAATLPPTTLPELDEQPVEEVRDDEDAYVMAEDDVRGMMATDFSLDVIEDAGDETQLVGEETVPGRALGDVLSGEPTDAPQPAMVADEAQVDPYVAHLAVQLTQFSLESTAIATLLSHHANLIAYAGDMSENEVYELNKYFIPHEWKAEPESASIRFVKLESSGKGYMLYSRLSEDNFILSMVFDGATPLRVIRRQGKRLAEALDSVPEEALEQMTQAVEATRPMVVEAPAEDVVDEPLTTYAYLWLLRDPNATLDKIIAQTIRTALNVQLSEQGWQIRRLEVTEDFIYLLADVPGDKPPHHIMRDLKYRSAQIIQGGVNGDVNPDATWADGYLIITPGRELEPEEIQEFIHFQRML